MAHGLSPNEDRLTAHNSAKRETYTQRIEADNGDDRLLAFLIVGGPLVFDLSNHLTPIVRIFDSKYPMIRSRNICTYERQMLVRTRSA